jgi:GDPmannose 4,6-dehydratase
LDKKIVIITGISGQDGQYLTKILVEKNYFVVGMTTSPKIKFYEEFSKNSLKVLPVNEYSKEEIKSIIESYPPSCIVNFAAQSSVRKSWDDQDSTWKSNHSIVLNFLDVIEEFQNRTKSQVHFVQAGSSEMFGNPLELPLNENSSMVPVSPYAKSKYEAYKSCQKSRISSNLKVANLILFNHESPRRGETFVTRKITRAATRIKLGLQEKLFLGNLDAKRDWGFAKDYVEAMWMMLQQDEPDDFVIATGETRTIREFLDLVFGQLDLDWSKYVEIDPRYFRPAEVDLLLGDASKAKKKFGWIAATDVRELARIMVDHDLELARREKHDQKFVNA